VNKEVDKLNKDIKTLLEAIRLDWHDVANLPLSTADRAGIRAHIKHLQSQISEILDYLDRTE
jgi:flagellar hook-associated protein FlgK